MQSLMLSFLSAGQKILLIVLNTILLFAFILGIPHVSLAQNSPLNGQDNTENQGYLMLDAGSIPAEKISQFVDAYLKVLNLIEQRERALQEAETSLESQRLEKEIEGEALQLIEEAGLTRQEYLQLLSLANIDPEFGERVAEAVAGKDYKSFNP